MFGHRNESSVYVSPYLYRRLDGYLALYVPARLMGKSIAQVSTKFFLLLGMHATGCCLLMALACSLQQLCGCEKCPPSTWAPECVVCILSTNRRGTIANPCVTSARCASPSTFDPAEQQENILHETYLPILAVQRQAALATTNRMTPHTQNS